MACTYMSHSDKYIHATGQAGGSIYLGKLYGDLAQEPENAERLYFGAQDDVPTSMFSDFQFWSFS